MNGALFAVVLLSAAGQLLVKAGADRTLDRAEQPHGEGKATSAGADALRFLRKAANPRLIAGAACVVAAPLLYARALASTGLSRAYGAMGLTYPLVVLGSALFLKEKLDRRQIAGTALIAAGFLVGNSLP